MASTHLYYTYLTKFDYSKFYNEYGIASAGVTGLFVTSIIMYPITPNTNMAPIAHTLYSNGIKIDIKKTTVSPTPWHILNPITAGSFLVHVVTNISVNENNYIFNPINKDNWSGKINKLHAVIFY